MSLLTIAQNVATNVSIEMPTAVLSNLNEDNLKIINYTTAAGEELARRVDWAGLRGVATITGTGANADHSLPAGFARLIPGEAVKSGANAVRVGLSADEWNSLTHVPGTPRYARLLGNKIAFFPYLALAATATVTYQSKNWAPSGAVWLNDSDEALVPEILIEKGAIWRWRRQMGQDYQDYLAEYEAALADLAAFDGGIRSP